jgi:hypothetical protein
MRNATLDVTQIAEFQRKQVQHSRNETDTTRLDWCETNFLSFGWHGGSAPTQKQLEAHLDKIIEAAA